MDQRDSYCLYLFSSEISAEGTVLVSTVGKEDPVELNSSLALQNGWISVG